MGKGKKNKAPPPEGIIPISDNRRARHDFEIIDTVEAGLVLLGTEVKSLRAKQVNFADSYALLKDGEVFILGLNISQLSSVRMQITNLTAPENYSCMTNRFANFFERPKNKVILWCH